MANKRKPVRVKAWAVVPTDERRVRGNVFVSPTRAEARKNHDLTLTHPGEWRVIRVEVREIKR